MELLLYDSRMGKMRANSICEKKRMSCKEDHEDRRKKDNGFFHPPQINDNEEDDEEYDKGDLEHVVLIRQEAEDGIPAGSERHGDGKHIVDEEGATGHHTCCLANSMGGYDVPAAAVREVLDDARIGKGNYKHRKGHGDGQ